VHYDPLLAKMITSGPTRDDAIDRMGAALASFVVEGVKTVIPFHQRVMQSSLFRTGSVHTQMIEQGVFG
jgi:acetyl-CoA carboxylase biotin carboxylase subunit